MKKIISIFLMMFLLAGCSSRPVFDTGIVKINNEYVLDVEIAKTNEQRARGLMYLRKLPDNYGMIFVYEVESFAVMWMKDTYVSLDMFFINQDGVITQIEENTEPLSLEHINAISKIKYVLETRAGLANDWQLKIGDKITILEN